MEYKHDIIVCPICGKVDINPKTHKENCNPEAEEIRKSNIWEDYKS